MTPKTNGGPAFPSSDTQSGYQGMSMRDWFAGQALAGMSIATETHERLAAIAYELADAMLKQRAK